MGFLDRFRSAREKAPAADPPSAPAASKPDGVFEPLRQWATRGADMPTLRSLLRDGLLAHGLATDTVDHVMARAKDAVVFSAGDTSSASSYVAGSPLLPPGESWPIDPDGEPLTFIAAFDLGGLPHLAPLPRTGHLLVYWSERYYEFERMDFRVGTRVFFVPDGVAPVVADRPAGAPSYPPVPLAAAVMPTIGQLSEAADDAQFDAFYEAYNEYSQSYDHQLLGVSRDVQGPVLDEVGYWFEQGFEASRADYSEAELAGQGWMLLAQIESTDDLMFGDAGALYLVMPEADLSAGRFDRVVGIMQCS